MAFLAAAAPYIGLVSTGVAAVNQYQAGKTANANAKGVAIQQEKQGKAAQREALNERKKANYAASRAQAVGAASGAGVDYDAIADLEAEGDYRVLSALYTGDSDAGLANFAASSTRRTGRATQRGAYMNAGSTILGGVVDYSFAKKYGDGVATHYSGDSQRYSGVGDYNVNGSTRGYA